MNGGHEIKAALRREVRARISMLTPEQRAEASRKMFGRAVAWPVWREARTVLLTWSLPDELAATRLIEAALADGKRVALPGYDAGSGGYVARRIEHPGSDLAAGKYGVREPRPECPDVPFAELDLLLVPGVAFDPAGNRLGRGGGFYDRMLALTTAAVSCGVGFDEQIVSGVPVEPHDVKLHYVLTPAELFSGRAGSA